MKKFILLIPALFAGMFLTACDEGRYGHYDDGPGYHGDTSVDFHYSSGRPYSRSYGPLVYRDDRYYYSRGGSYVVYDRPTYAYNDRVVNRDVRNVNVRNVERRNVNVTNVNRTNINRTNVNRTDVDRTDLERRDVSVRNANRRAYDDQEDVRATRRSTRSRVYQSDEQSDVMMDQPRSGGTRVRVMER